MTLDNGKFTFDDGKPTFNMFENRHWTLGNWHWTMENQHWTMENRYLTLDNYRWTMENCHEWLESNIGQWNTYIRKLKKKTNFIGKLTLEKKKINIVHWKTEIGQGKKAWDYEIQHWKMESRHWTMESQQYTMKNRHWTMGKQHLYLHWRQHQHLQHELWRIYRELFSLLLKDGLFYNHLRY